LRVRGPFSAMVSRSENVLLAPGASVRLVGSFPVDTPVRFVDYPWIATVNQG
jgi:hypothetical protein